jgi:hypothetical protein
MNTAGAAETFFAARDFILKHRTDYDTAVRAFHSPAQQHFNWALDYFDTIAAGNERPALHIVDGYLTFVGRVDDVFKASDYTLSPFELESVLIEHAAVAEAAVVPSPDPLRHAVPKAFVTLAAGFNPSRELAAEILSHCRNRLAPYKRIPANRVWSAAEDHFREDSTHRTAAQRNGARWRRARPARILRGGPAGRKRQMSRPWR